MTISIKKKILKKRPMNNIIKLSFSANVVYLFVRSGRIRVDDFFLSLQLSVTRVAEEVIRGGKRYNFPPWNIFFM